MDSLFLYSAIIMASPTATSAAATAITNNTMICPSIEWRNLENATKVRLTAFSISSIAMKITSTLRRINTPATPITKRAALRIKYAFKGTVALMSPHTSLRYLLAKTMAPIMAMRRMRSEEHTYELQSP